MSFESEFDELDRRYREAFGEGIPLAQLPEDDGQALALVKQALAEGDTRVIDELVPLDAQS